MHPDAGTAHTLFKPGHGLDHPPPLIIEFGRLPELTSS